MAPAEGLSPPGSASYSSDTMTVGDGTWDFVKNTFLLPNLVGLNFETMQYNGMGNRFSTVPQYHRLILGHGILAAITFLFLVPFAVMTARFYRGRPGMGIRYHAWLNVMAVGLTTILFILGFFAVGPYRALTNPHHGIGVAIYVLILLQAIGGRMITGIRKPRSFRIMVHQWSGRAIAILGIVQVPLGLTLYGSPRYLFILYSLWMSFLLLLYFVFSFRRAGHYREDYRHDHHDEEGSFESGSEKKKSKWRWLGPLALGGALFAFMRRKKNKREESRSRSRSRSPSHPRSRSLGRGPEVIPSRRGSASYVDDDKYTERTRRDGGGGLMKTLLGVGTAVGAGALLSKWMDRRKDQQRDEAYSEVATNTPDRHSRLRRDDPRRTEASETDYFEGSRYDRRREPLLPGPGSVAAGAAASRLTDDRPSEPRPSHQRQYSRHDLESDYTSYISQPRRPRSRSRSPGGGGGGGGGVKKGLLAGLGLGWLAKKAKDRYDRREEEERRSGARPPRYTGDGYGSPPPRRSSGRRYDRDAASEPSYMDPRGGRDPGYGPGGAAGGAPVTPGAPPVPGSGAGRSGRARSRTRDESDVSGSEAYMAGGGRPPVRRTSSGRRRDGEAAAAAAAASASLLAADLEERRRVQQERPSRSERASASPGHPVSLSVRMHDDPSRKVTLRRLPEEEARHRRGSVSTLSGDEGAGGTSTGPSRRRYRRESATHRSQSVEETAAERAVIANAAGADPRASDYPLVQSNAPSASGRSRPPKDSAYYSGGPPAGPSTGTAPPGAGPAVSSIGSPDSHGTWSGMSPTTGVTGGDAGEPGSQTAEEKRRRRRIQRRNERPVGVDYN